MNYLDVIFIALIEGITEFIPVSSTGHMIIYTHFAGINDNDINSFIIFIQVGAILAVLNHYRALFIELFLDFKNKKTTEFLLNTRFPSILHLVISTTPAVIAGLLFYDLFRNILFGAYAVSIGLIVGGIIMIIVEKLKKQYYINNLKQITLRQALYIGIGQCFSLWPGISRSGATITTGIILGIKHKSAADYSFILALPILMLAACYDLYKNWQHLTASLLPFFITGCILAFIVSLFSIKFFLKILPQYKLMPFGFYRIIIGFIILYFLSY